MFCSAVYLLALVVASVAHGVEPPPFDPGQRVVLQPDSLAFPTTQVQRAVGEVERTTYVVVLEHVVDGRIAPGHASETEEAIEAIWDRWAVQGLDVAESNLVVLGLDDREVRVRAGTRWDAELGLGGPALLPLIDAHFMPRAAAADLDGGLAALVTGLDGEIRDRLSAREAAARNRARLTAAMPFLGVLLVGSTGLGGFAALGMRARRARRRFEDALAVRRQELAQAEARLVDVGLTVSLRDEIVALKLKGPRTEAAVGQITERLDRLRVGVSALTHRLDTIARSVGAGPLAASPWNRAISELDAPFPYDTGELSDQLFAPETRTLTIDPAAFRASLEADWADARAQWDRVLDAIDASMRQARDDLSIDDLEAARAVLRAAGLPEGWVAEHPLGEAPDEVWARLDALRREDPVAYLDELDAVGEEADRWEAFAAALVEGRQAAEEARRQALASVRDAVVVARTPEEDPLEVARRAQVEYDALQPILATPGDADGALEAIERAVAGWEALDGLNERWAQAAREAEPAIGRAAARLETLKAAIATQRQRLETQLADHAPASLGSVFTELSETAGVLRLAEEAVADARQQLTHRSLLGASERAEQALAHADSAERELTELVAAVHAAVDAESEARALQASLDKLRGEQERRLVRAGGIVSKALSAGDDLRDRTLAAQPGAIDWAERARAIRSVHAAWETAVAGVEAEHAAEQRRRAAAARRSSSSASSSGWSSSSRSSSTRSTYRSSSSSRSSGRSLSSSSRSSGRSFSSSRRSAGRKF